MSQIVEKETNSYYRNGNIQQWIIWFQVTYYVVDSDRNEGKDYFEINRETGEIFTKVMFDREKQGAYALEVEARDGAPSARPNSNGQPNSGMSTFLDISPHAFDTSFNGSRLKFDLRVQKIRVRSISNLLGIHI